MAGRRKKRRAAKRPAFPGLRHDPIPWLLSAEDEAITAFVRRDLLGKRTDVKAGYGSHPSIARAFRWLLDTRQDDGGWAIVARTRDQRIVKDGQTVARRPPLEADRSKPFSHWVTGMALRAFAIHPQRRRLRAAQDGTRLLKSRLFKRDKYADRCGTEYWTKFTYPFGFTDLLTALDSFGRMGLAADDPDVAAVIDWFAQRQQPDGSFDLVMRRGVGDKRLPRWLGLALCCALGRFPLGRSTE